MRRLQLIQIDGYGRQKILGLSLVIRFTFLGFVLFASLVQDLYRAGSRDIALLFLRFVLQICCRPAVTPLQRSGKITYICYIPNWKCLGQLYVLKCCRPAAEMLQACCKSATALPKRSRRITYRCYMPNLKSLGQMYIL